MDNKSKVEGGKIIENKKQLMIKTWLALKTELMELWAIIYDQAS